MENLLNLIAILLSQDAERIGVPISTAEFEDVDENFLDSLEELTKQDENTIRVVYANQAYLVTVKAE